MASKALEKLCKWRAVLAGWHSGTKSIDEPGSKAMRDLMDKWLVMRAEVNTMIALLAAKGVFNEAEFKAALDLEAAALDRDMEEIFLGFRTVHDVITIYDLALARKTMAKLGFPP